MKRMTHYFNQVLGYVSGTQIEELIEVIESEFKAQEKANIRMVKRISDLEERISKLALNQSTNRNR